MEEKEEGQIEFSVWELSLVRTKNQSKFGENGELI